MTRHHVSKSNNITANIALVMEQKQFHVWHGSNLWKPKHLNTILLTILIKMNIEKKLSQLSWIGELIL